MCYACACVRACVCVVCALVCRARARARACVCVCVWRACACVMRKCVWEREGAKQYALQIHACVRARTHTHTHHDMNQKLKCAQWYIFILQRHSDKINSVERAPRKPFSERNPNNDMIAGYTHTV